MHANEVEPRFLVASASCEGIYADEPSGENLQHRKRAWPRRYSLVRRLNIKKGEFVTL